MRITTASSKDFAEYMISLEDKVVVVTGASKGIGLAIARKFAIAGAKVTLLSRGATRKDSSLRGFPGGGADCLLLKCDVRKSAEMKKVITRIKKQFGRIDIWVNNAGVGAHKPITETTDREYDAMLDTNLRAVYYTLKLLIPLFRKQKPTSDSCTGQIINISSGAARIGAANLAVYAASKAALNALSESVANEVRADGIKISVLSPASTNTNLMRNLTGKKPGRPLSPSKAATKLTVEEVAEATVFLASQNLNAWTSMMDIRPLQVKN